MTGWTARKSRESCEIASSAVAIAGKTSRYLEMGILTWDMRHRSSSRPSLIQGRHRELSVDRSTSRNKAFARAREDTRYSQVFVRSVS